MLNSYVTRFILQDNWLTTEGARLVGDMLTENNTIEYLNLKECRIGAEGIKFLKIPTDFKLLPQEPTCLVKES